MPTARGMHGCRRGAVALVVTLIARFSRARFRAGGDAGPDQLEVEAEAPVGPEHDHDHHRSGVGSAAARVHAPDRPRPEVARAARRREQGPPHVQLRVARRQGPREGRRSSSGTCLQAQLAKLRAQQKRTQHDLDVAHDDIQAAAVEAYMNSGSSRLEAAITAIAQRAAARDGLQPHDSSHRVCSATSRTNW